MPGPDGPGGGNPVAQWSGGGPVGKYTIVFCGASVPGDAIPTSSQWTLIVTAGLLLIGGAILIARRGFTTSAV